MTPPPYIPSRRLHICYFYSQELTEEHNLKSAERLNYHYVNLSEHDTLGLRCLPGATLQSNCSDIGEYLPLTSYMQALEANAMFNSYFEHRERRYTRQAVSIQMNILMIVTLQYTRLHGQKIIRYSTLFPWISFKVLEPHKS